MPALKKGSTAFTGDNADTRQQGPCLVPALKKGSTAFTGANAVTQQQEPCLVPALKKGSTAVYASLLRPASKRLNHA